MYTLFAMETYTTSAINLRSLLRLAPLAGLTAAVINALIFFAGSAAGAFPATVLTPGGEPLSVVPVIISSFVPALLGGLLLALLNRFTRQPLRIFTIVTVLVVLFSVYSPFSLVGAPPLMIALLELMHLVVAGVVLYIFSRYARH